MIKRNQTLLTAIAFIPTIIIMTSACVATSSTHSDNTNKIRPIYQGACDVNPNLPGC